MKLFNTLTKKVEAFVPWNSSLVTLYCCGPTVYDYAHIGNFRTYTTTDLLVRTLRHFGYRVKYVMNITDVGHLVSDADEGEDKMEKGARREGKTAWDIAKFYTDAFLADSKRLNLIEPDVRPKPTEHIPEQLAMVETLLHKGIAYRIDDGIYFDTSKFSGYGVLAGQDIEELKAGARVEPNPQKKNPTDFALWKFSAADQGPRRQMEWFLEGPHKGELATQDTWITLKKRGDRKDVWFTTVGFPGWHIECSAMSRKHLGDQIDIHTGGADLIPIHHTNEIAQSEATSGKSPFVRFWVHGQFILVDGEKMSKSKENFYRLSDIEAKGYEALALRYFYMTAHYRAFLNFTWTALESAQKALKELRTQSSELRVSGGKRKTLSQEKLGKIDDYRKRFDDALANDLNMPQVLAVVWEVVKSTIPSQDKYDLLLDFDEVLGFNLRQSVTSSERHREVPQEVSALVQKRQELRKQKKFSEADAVRQEIEEKGYAVKDTEKGPHIKLLR